MIKAEIVGPILQKKPYPCIKISQQNLVVLFTERDVGIVLYDGSERQIPWPIGHTTDWVESKFELLESSITLRNS